MSTIDPNQFIELLKKSMIDRGIDYELIIKEFGQVRASEERAAGKEFGLRDHVRGLVLALLSCQRPWGPIAAQQLSNARNIYKTEPSGPGLGVRVSP